MQPLLQAQIIELGRKIQNAQNIVFCIGPNLFDTNQDNHFYFDGEIFKIEDLCTMTGGMIHTDAYKHCLAQYYNNTTASLTLIHELIAFLANYHSANILTTTTDGIFAQLCPNTLCLYGTFLNIICPHCGEAVSPMIEECSNCNKKIIPRVNHLRQYDLVPQDRVNKASELLVNADLIVIMGDSLNNVLFPSLITKNNITSENIVIIYPTATKFDDLSDLVIHTDITTILTNLCPEEAERRRANMTNENNPLKTYLKEIFTAGAYFGQNECDLKAAFEYWYKNYTGRD